MGNDAFMLCVKCVPKPVWVSFSANIRPLLINFTNQRNIFISDSSAGDWLWGALFNVRITVLIPTFSPRTVPRTPETFMVILIIFCFILGLQVSKSKHAGRPCGITDIESAGDSMSCVHSSKRHQTDSEDNGQSLSPCGAK